MPSDKYGDYDADAGSVEPMEDRCQAVLVHTFERYGEKRYCTRLPESCFIDDGSDFCKTHKSREKLMDQQKENFKTGAFVKSYTSLFGYLDPHKRIVVIELFGELLQDSMYDFEVEYITESIDLSNVDWADTDSVNVNFPLPTQNRQRAKYLWVAALEGIKMEAIEYKIFEDAFSAAEYGLAEREITVTANEFGQVTDAGEHHLNLPLSRVIKDHKDLMKLGGVNPDIMGENDEGEVVMREWVLDVEPDDKPEPESASSNSADDVFERIMPEDIED
ncbi:hypothetical protein M1M34_gp004 [Haloarcula tailed virus 2]|uniref:Uncharacterized protein n=1 Tax=Haloarcula tailed virus 2 TaxID=2877989 RepID=A0AAE9BY32_9CAUD|nr:hypothetical protein M1M34_gp004 [Haloarcula tailed virus 2]UBF23155.1 hypothetical protein HATV-2_gp4 [Haloarcula tailed virus 2]